jgi:hypothetical protein
VDGKYTLKQNFLTNTKTMTIIEALEAFNYELVKLNKVVYAEHVKTGEIVQYFVYPEYDCPEFIQHGVKIRIKNDILYINGDSFGYSMPCNSLAIEAAINCMKKGKRFKITEFKTDFDLERKPEQFTDVCTLSKTEIDIIKKASLFADTKNQFHPAMGCVLLDENNIVATDAHALFKKSHYVFNFFKYPGQILIDKSAQKFIKAAKSEVKILQSDKHIRYVTGDKVLTVDKVVESFPDYERVIPTDNPDKCTLNRSKLIELVKSAAVYANQASNLIKLSLNGECIISACDLDFTIENSNHMPVESNTFDGEIGFNSTILLQCLQVNKNEKVTLKIKSNDRAVLIDNTLLMPMNLNS